MFLPGIESSRLYDFFGNQLWEPKNGGSVPNLFLSSNGSSLGNGIATNDVISTTNALPGPLQLNIYKSFFNDLNAWKNTDHIIVDYAIVPYDWRLTLDDILNYGNQFPDGRIFYSGSDTYRATSTPYIIQTLKNLAATSRTGKVTIVTHSNGGLVAKALIKKLKDTNDPLLDKIDTLVLVDVPQTGTPEAIGAVLHGLDQGLPKEFWPFLLDDQNARAFASTSPMVYHLLPSSAYFSGQGSAIFTPPVIFDDGTSTQPFIAAYGHVITSATELKNFLLGSDGRPQANFEDLKSPLILSPTLLAYAENLHQSLDSNTVIPSSIVVHEIGGWGNDTLSSIRYFTNFICTSRTPQGICTKIEPHIDFSPETTIDGDGTVITESSLAMSTSSTNVKRWWVDLGLYNVVNHPILTALGQQPLNHGNVFEVSVLRLLVKNLIQKNTTSTLQYVSEFQPNISSAKRLLFKLHSPLNLSVTDEQGNEVSSAMNEIPGATFKRFGDVLYISVPANAHPTVHLSGYATGSFTLETEEKAGDITVATTTFAAIPSTSSTRATISFPSGTIANASPLNVDQNGDGTIDQIFAPKLDAVVIPDIAPPTTAISLTGIQGTNGWFTSNVKITFTAIDSESGVKNTIFSLDSAATSTGTSTVISTEGVHTLKYLSTDNADNQEEPKEITIKIDKTASEAIIGASTSTKDLLIVGADNLSTTTTIKSTATTTTVTDQAGNVTKLNFQKTFSGNLLTFAKLSSVQYGTSTPVSLPSSFTYLWNPLSNPPTLLSQTVIADNIFAIEAAYDKSKNKTTIIVKKKGAVIQTTTVTGLAIVKLTTKKGAVGYSW
jgi:pimeloyl-ACP methyl ester carboxylesterase